MSTTVGGVEVEAVEYIEEAETVRTQFDQEKISPSMAVVVTLAEATGVDPVELDPLYSAIDPDALDSFVRVHSGTSGDTRVSFSHENYGITVQSYGVVTITPERGPPVERYEPETGK